MNFLTNTSALSLNFSGAFHGAKVRLLLVTPARACYWKNELNSQYCPQFTCQSAKQVSNCTSRRHAHSSYDKNKLSGNVQRKNNNAERMLN